MTAKIGELISQQWAKSLWLMIRQSIYMPLKTV